MRKEVYSAYYYIAKFSVNLIKDFYKEYIERYNNGSVVPILFDKDSIDLKDLSNYWFYHELFNSDTGEYDSFIGFQVIVREILFGLWYVKADAEIDDSEFYKYFGIKSPEAPDERYCQKIVTESNRLMFEPTTLDDPEMFCYNSELHKLYGNRAKVGLGLFGKFYYELGF